MATAKKAAKTATAPKRSPYGSVKFKTVDEYNASFPKNIKALLDEIRTTIKQSAPKAEEVISYNMPAFKLEGPLVFYAGYEKHIGFYPTPGAIIAFKDELSKYATSKGAIQFPIESGIPVSLVKKIVKFRLLENAEKAKTKKASKAKK